MKQIAQITKGEYFNAVNAEALSKVYEKRNTLIGFEKNTEVTALVLALALICAVIGGGLSILWYNQIFTTRYLSK